MRTRSQQASPGGFISLDDERAPRRTRGTRSASQQPDTEPSEQPATRSRPQRTVKKATTTKKTTKTQTRKFAKRPTRKTTRKTDNSTSGDEGQGSGEDVEHTESTPQENKESPEADPEAPEAATSAHDTALLEPKSSERESQVLSPSLEIDTPQDPGTVDYPHEPHNSQEPLPTPNVFDFLLDYPGCGGSTDPTWYEWPAEEIDDILAGFGEPSSPPPKNDDQFFALGNDLVARLDAALALHDAQESDVAEGEQKTTGNIEETNINKSPPAPAAVDVVNVPSTAEQAVAEPTTAESRESEQSDEVRNCEKPKEQTEASSPLASAVHPGEGMVVEDESISGLTFLLEKMSLVNHSSDEATVSSMGSTTMLARVPETAASEKESVSASTTTSDRLPILVSGPSVDTSPLASIYSDVLPVCPALNSLMPAERIQQRPSTIFQSPMPDSPSSICDCGQQILERPLAPVVLEGAPDLIPGPPLRPVGARSSRPLQTPSPKRVPRKAWSVLSPIPEESDELRSSAVAYQERAEKLVLSPAVTLKDPSHRAIKNQRLTPMKVNRKRARPSTSSNNSPSDPETPYANKRRNLGPPGSTPFSRRHTPLSRRISNTAVPYSERLRRRRAESQGRIHRTVFRLPQLVAQAEADRQTSQTPPLSPCPEPLQSSFDFSVDLAQVEQSAPEQSFASQEPSTPEPAQRGWNIRGLLNSVPRSFSRFLPSFGRSPAASEVQAQQPSSELVRRTRDRQLVLTTIPQKRETQSSRRLSEQPPTKRARNLSYSLFPAPIDRALYLGDVPKTPTTPQASVSVSTETGIIQKSEAQSLTSNSSKAPITGPDAAPQDTGETSDVQQKKRKRSPSPDVIPNPPGSSYGMDLDYFCYSSESDEEEPPAPRTEPKKITEALPKGIAARNAIQSERPASKKVRFDASPEDTPSKIRLARATDPYRGKHFVGMGGSQTFSAPTTPTPVSRANDTPQRSPGFIPNKQGTFQLDYDDDSEYSDTSSPAGAPSPSTPETMIPAQATPESTPSTTSRQPARSAAPPATPARVDDEALARARSQAEKYKPKTPSGLRTTSRYSSPLVRTPDITPAPPAAQMSEKFGDDQFAKDAQWLYDNCPSGDLSQLVWPPKKSLSESLNVRPSSLQLLSDIWDPSEVDRGYNAFKHSLNEFEKTLA